MEKRKNFEITDNFLQKWQSVVNTIAELVDVPTGLIMRIVDSKIKVFVSSEREENPYTPGDSGTLLGSGLYCERVIKTKDKLLIPNALKDEEWKENPDVKLNMISYLGLPILLPDNTPFGTICILDNKENHYSDVFIRVMKNFREIIEKDLEIIYMNQQLGDRNRTLIEFISEMQDLRGLLRICAHCKKIKNTDDQWIEIETYIENHTEAEFSHGLCENCLTELYGRKMMK